MTVDFIGKYIAYSDQTEPPAIYHRWCAIAGIGAMLGRSCYIPFGHFRIFPNIYCMLMGEPAARKSTAIKQMKKLLSSAGYDKFAATKTTKEKFLVDLEEGINQDDIAYDKATALDLDFDVNLTEPREVFIVADEFNDFTKPGDLEFYTTLGNLWDWDDEERPFTQRVKNSKSVSIFQPTVSLLGGNTPENFAKAFPPEIIGQGFLSRLILIHGKRSGKLFTFPPTPDAARTKELVQELSYIRSNAVGEISFSAGARKILDTIYRSWDDVADVRFKSYSNRRFTQLLKVSIICAAARGSTSISEDVVVTANTYLAAAEQLMPRALGEFGEAKSSKITNKVMDLLLSAGAPLTLKDIWKNVSNDLSKPADLNDIMSGLQQAEKIQFLPNRGYLPRMKPLKDRPFVDFLVLTEEEIHGI